MKTTLSFLLIFATLTTLAADAQARGRHGFGGRGARHAGHANHFRAVRFQGRVVEHWPSEEERLSSSPAVVLAVQRSLRASGFYRGPLTGKVDAGTHRAIRQLQAEEGMRNTGALDGAVLASLGLRLGDGR